MTSSRPVVLIVSDLADRIQATLEKVCFGAELHYVSRPEQLSASLQQLNPEVVFSMKGPNFGGQMHRPIMDYPSVQWVQVGGSGYDHLVPWDRNRVMLTNCSGVLSRYLAETVTGAMLALNSNLPIYLRQQQQRQWLPHEFRSLAGQTLMVIGLGQIGRWVARNSRALGMRVIGVRRDQTAESDVDILAGPEEVPALLGEADVVSLHLRLSPETQHYFSDDMFGAMKQNALFINTSRGQVVDEQALVQALLSGRLRGAYLDVFEQEPLPQDSPLWTMPQVIITPHCSDNIQGWYIEFAKFFGGNLQRWMCRETLLNRV